MSAIQTWTKGEINNIRNDIDIDINNIVDVMLFIESLQMHQKKIYLHQNGMHTKNGQ